MARPRYPSDNRQAHYKALYLARKAGIAPAVPTCSRCGLTLRSVRRRLSGLCWECVRRTEEGKQNHRTRMQHARQRRRKADTNLPQQARTGNDRSEKGLDRDEKVLDGHQAGEVRKTIALQQATTNETP